MNYFLSDRWLCLAVIFLCGYPFTWQHAAEDVLERSVSLMGTTLHMTLYEPDRNRALVQSEEWIRIVEDAEQELSNWRESSELSRFNRNPVGLPFELSASLCRLIPQLQTWTAKTEGTFDPGVGQLMTIWGLYDQARVPSSSEIEQARARTGLLRIEIDEQTCTGIRKSEILLDSGAFGKGEALERILINARANHSAAFQIDFGGQILVNGKPPSGTAWDIELADPVNRLAGSGIRIHFKSGSVSTSGGSERDKTVDGKRIGHTLDPRSGLPASSFGSVTVWHESPLAADILSTALYVFGPEKGMAYANTNDIAACYLVVRNGKVEANKSNRFSRLLVLD